MKQETQLPDFMHAGWRGGLGEHTFSAEEIIAFASLYDPQEFHLDAEAAKHSLLGGLCTSGWHTASMWMRKLRDSMAAENTRLIAEGKPGFEFGPSPGFSNLKWYRPVFAGDTIAYSSETLECRPSNSRPGWYLLTGRQGGMNQNGDPVITFDTLVIIKFPA